MCAELGGVSLRAAPKAHPQSSGSVGQLQRTSYGQLRILLQQVEQNTGTTTDSSKTLYPWAVKHAQWLLNRYLIHSDGTTSYFRTWNRKYDGGLYCCGEVAQAQFPLAKTGRKSDPRWETALWLGRDSEADGVIVATSDGVHKVRTVKESGIDQNMRALPRMPKISTEGFGEQTTDFVLPGSLMVTGKIRSPPGLTKIDEAVKHDSEETHSEALQDLPHESTEIAERPSASAAGIKHSIDEKEPSGIVARPPKSVRPDPDSRFPRRGEFSEISTHCVDCLLACCRRWC